MIGVWAPLDHAKRQRSAWEGVAVPGGSNEGIHRFVWSGSRLTEGSDAGEQRKQNQA
jgi:hypothetical protein